MDGFHQSSITGKIYKCGAINTANLAPHDDTSYYLYPLRLITHTKFSVAPTKPPHVQIDRASPFSPRVVPTPAPTSQHTDRLPRVTHSRSADPIYHLTHSRSHIPPPDDETASRIKCSGQGLANLGNAELSPSTASLC